MTQRERSVRTDVIGEIIVQWRVSGQGNFAELAYLSGVSQNHIRDIIAGRHERIRKRTAARLLAVVGEPLRPELAEEFESWRYETWLRTRDLLNAH